MFRSYNYGGFLKWILRFSMSMIYSMYYMLPSDYPYPDAPCMEYLPTLLGDFWGKSG